MDRPRSMTATADTIITVVLFVALIPAVLCAVAIGLHLLMLGDGVATKRGFAGVLIGVVGVPIAAVAVYLAAAIWAWNTEGYTFYYPIVALVAGTVLTMGLSALSGRIARRG